MRWWWLAVLTACGRIGFDPFGAPDDGRPSDSRAPDSMFMDAAAGPLIRVGASSSTIAANTMTGVQLAANDLLIVVTHRNGGDTNAVTWATMPLVEDEPLPAFGAGPSYLSVWSVRTTASASGNVIADGAAVPNDIFVYVIPNSPAAPFDKSANAAGAIGNASSGATPLTSQAKEIVLGVLGGDAGTMFDGMWETGFSLLDNQSTNGVDTTIAYRVVNSQGLFSATYNNFTPRNWSVAAVTYKVQ